MLKSGIRLLSGVSLFFGFSLTATGLDWNQVNNDGMPELSPVVSGAVILMDKNLNFPDQIASEVVAQKLIELQKYQKDARLRLETVKHSLTGSHFHYRQYIGETPTEEGQYVVSVNRETGEVYQTFDRTVTQELFGADQKSRELSSEEALEAAWKFLKGRGSLLNKPVTEKTLYRTSHGLKNGYMVRVAVSEPFGYWHVLVNAVDGEIIKYRDERITRNPVAGLDELNKAYQGEAHNLSAALKNLNQTENTDYDKNQFAADGRGIVFDPDPRTTLNSANIHNDSAAASFEDAYLEKVLRDLTIANGVHTLKGPWVTIKDFESPNIAPSTSSSGNWSAKRDDVAFHDVMTYYHLDTNQRYMQSLGFRGETGIQYNSIETDANGLGGADNSHFIPSSNRIAFGHGCVPDNEDADVILHEYGHAIHYSINPNWGGGDSGAMGEGFGDYWAASYSISRPNGIIFQPFQVFTWDGPNCWPGRRLDKLDARYDHSTSYGAHARMNGFVSDELWATPLFQALWTLVQDGYSREAVDRIILQAHFGLGSGMKMRGMAEAIIRTARELYPDGPYADVFLDKFSLHNIIEMPRADFEVSSVTFTGAGPNEVPDPGEHLGLVFKIRNPGTHDASGISGVLVSRDQNVVVERASVNFPDVRAGGESEAEAAFQITLADIMNCGDVFGMALRLRFEGGASTEKELLIDIPTGVADALDQEVTPSPPLPIPDNDSTGVRSVMQVAEPGQITRARGLEVSIHLEHTYIGDLKVTLTSPSGKSLLLHNKSGGSQDNLIGIYPETLDPAEPLDGMVGENVAGDWELYVQDSASRDTGVLKKWGIKAVRSVQCEAPLTKV